MEVKNWFLFDTNIFLEIFLSQKNSELSKKLLNHNKITQIYLSDFSFHSIGVILSKKNKSDIFELFIKDILQCNKISIISISLENMINITQNINKYNLDFDDAYQLTLSQIFDINIVTYDSDFNNIEINSIHPKELINQL